jgi:bifunctional DNA-binding transcriptional regulator/antitoxin component of YhaV-PrlF toxin-antitoxin module
MFITSKGQVTTSVEIRRKAGLHSHTEVEFVIAEGRVLLQSKPGGKSRGGAKRALLPDLYIGAFAVVRRHDAVDPRRNLLPQLFPQAQTGQP